MSSGESPNQVRSDPSSLATSRHPVPGSALGRDDDVADGSPIMDGPDQHEEVNRSISISEPSFLNLSSLLEHRFWVARTRLRLERGNMFVLTGADESRVRALRVRKHADQCLAALDGLYLLLKVAIHQRRRLLRERNLLKKELLRVERQLVESRNREKQAQYRAFHDELTSLPNRRFFRQRLRAAFSGDAPCASKAAIIYLDLDGFKALNDEHGHQAGDDLLKLVAARLLCSVRAEDMLCRLGGDEFACLVFGLTANQLLTMANELYAVVSAPCRIGTTLRVVRPSIGIAMAPDHGTDADSILKSADAAMYVAKKTGSGYSFATTTNWPLECESL